jgi:F-type H+-transporting ATPase subunit gamma
MASTRQLKSRIRSVGSTRQITKAMQLVAASKMRRAQEASRRSSLYARSARQLLTQLRELTDVKRHPLFRERPVKSRLVILITSDKGLAGAYNSNVLKNYTNLLREDIGEGIATRTIAIGRKGSQLVARLKGVELVGAYHEFPEQPTGNDLRPIIDTAIDMFTSGEVDAVDVFYTEYVSSIRQEASVQRLLPAGFAEAKVSEALQLSSFEPSVSAVLDNATRRLLEVQLFQAILDAVASEHSMRMLAMQNATDNATDLVDDLTLEMNKVRQAAITQELSEITGGVEAIK